MKRLLLIIAALCITSHASAKITPKFEFGIKAGLDFQSNNFKNTLKNIDFKSNTGWFIGAQGELSFGNFAIRPEVIFSHNSFDVEGADGKLKLNRLDIPLLLQYEFFGFLAIQAGPTFGVMTDVGGKTEDTKWDLARPSIGYAVGAEVKVWKLGISARYNGAFNRSEVLGFSTGEYKISTFQIGVGYYF